MPDYTEGQTATAKDGKSRVVYRKGMWVRDTSFVPEGSQPGGRAKTTPQDMAALNAASAKAEGERDNMRTYSQAGEAIDRMGTGPVKAAFLDAIVPDEDGGLLDKAGALLGTPLRMLVDQKTMDARDHLKTVSANVALAGSQMMKGSSSDKDTALMRMSGIGPAKQPAENHRIINQAIHDSGLEQTRALVKSQWIGKYGSLANPSPNGMTYEQAAQLAERSYETRLAARRQSKSMPSAPPIRRGNTVTIDLDGNPIR